MDQKEATETFMRRVMVGAYEQPIDAMRSLLMKGPIGKKPKAADMKLHVWYESLDSDSQSKIDEMVAKTAHHVLFGFLVMLDNLSMGYPIEGVLSDFALYVQSYPDQAARSDNHPDAAIRINDLGNDLDLHDLLEQYIKG